MNNIKKITKKEKMDKFVKTLKKVAPWIIGGAAVAGGGYALYKAGVSIGTMRITNKVLSGSTLDVLAKSDDGKDEKAIVTVCGIVSKSEDEYVDNHIYYNKNRSCSDGYIEKAKELDREKYKKLFSKYVGK